MDWQPIETAKKDGSHILAYIPDQDIDFDYSLIYVVHWDDDIGREGWVEAGGERFALYNPTHWLPLPDPPKGIDNPA